MLDDREPTREEITERVQANIGLVKRLKDGDVWALPALFEAVTGAKVASMSVVEVEEQE